MNDTDSRSSALKRRLFISVCFAGICSLSCAQTQSLQGQYFRFMQAYAPGLTGANDHLRITSGIRRQWAGLTDSPESYFLGIDTNVPISGKNMYLNNSIRVSDLSPYEKKDIKIGVGTYVIHDIVGPLYQTQAMLNLASHVLITKNTYLSLGVSAGYSGVRVDGSKLFVLDPDDEVYQEYIASGKWVKTANFQLSTGLSIYSDHFYFSYSMGELVNSSLSEGKILESVGSSLSHVVLGGYRWIKQRVELIPNILVSYNPNTPFLMDIGVRVRYNHDLLLRNNNLMLGFSYRNNGSLITMAGLTYNDHYSIGYSYESKVFNASSNLFGVNHEFFIGFRISQGKKFNPMW